MNTTPSRVNNSLSGFSSPSLLQPCTKPFSGRPARPQMTCPTREAGEAIRERPGIVYPLLPRAQRLDTRVAIEAALPEAAVRRTSKPSRLPLWILDDTSLPQRAPSPRRRMLHEGSRANAVAIARQACIGHPSARHPMDTGVNRRTPPDINKIWK